jgi:hypothetical protein
LTGTYEVCLVLRYETRRQGIEREVSLGKVEASVNKGRFVEDDGIISYHLPFPDEVIAAVSTRGGGESGGVFSSLNIGAKTGDDPSTVLRNRKIFLDSLSIPEDRLAIPEQTHSAEVKEVSEPGRYPNCDGLITNAGNLFLTLSIADCCPIFGYDPRKSAVGICHAGWRGTRDRMAQELVEKLRSSFGSDPADLLVSLGPSIGPCCYKVGEDLRDAFDHSLFRQSGLEYYLDLWEANRRQLVASGLKPSSIFLSRVCTSCGPELFFSHRRDLGKTGRMMAVIGMRG